MGEAGSGGLKTQRRWITIWRFAANIFSRLHTITKPILPYINELNINVPKILIILNNRKNADPSPGTFLRGGGSVRSF